MNPAPKSQGQQHEPESTHQRYATERRRQLTVLLLLAAVILLGSVLAAGTHNVFPPNWWHIDLP